jgi:ribonuclease BN (tRNA processing enzyme)
MNITLLGTGTPALETDRQSAAVLIQTARANLLFDAGRGVNIQLLRAGLSPADIDSIFITHHHWDHIGDLGDVILGAWHAGRENALHIYGPHGIQAIVSALLDTVYQPEIAFTLAMEAQLGNACTDIRAIVAIHEIESRRIDDHDDVVIRAEFVDHGNRFISQAEWPCLGYRVESEGQVVAISGDTIPCEGLEKLADQADVLVQCCFLAESEITSPTLEFLAGKVIASSGQIGQIAARSYVKKLVLTHFRPKSDALMQSIVDDIRKTYSGEIVLGRDLMSITL